MKTDLLLGTLWRIICPINHSVVWLEFRASDSGLKNSPADCVAVNASDSI